MTSPAPAPRLRVTGLTKSFFGVQVLHEISFEAYGGRVLALLGENGSGKSTTLNVLTGGLARDGGSVFLDGEPFTPSSPRDAQAAGIAFVQQELNIFPNLSVAENLRLGSPPLNSRLRPKYTGSLFSSRRKHVRARRCLRRVNLNVSPDALVETLSSGERQLLEIARALSHPARVLILDEPTTALTDRESARLFELIRRLQRRGVAIVFISHNLEHVLGLADDIVVLRDGRITLTCPAAGLTANDLVRAMIGRPIEALFPQRTRPTASTPVLETQSLSVPGILDDISLQVGHGEILGLAGLMGSGRSTLARTVFGLTPHAGGSVRIDGRSLPQGDVRARLAAGVAFVTEDRRHEGLMLDASVADNMALAALPQFASPTLGLVRRAELLQAERSLLPLLNLKSGAIDTTPVRTLSGGNQQKVVLARWLLNPPRLFILDEPTRGVDVGAKQDIYRLLVKLVEQGVAILIVSSELEELLGLCDRILVLHRGRLNGEFRHDRFDRHALLAAAFGQSAAV